MVWSQPFAYGATALAVIGLSQPAVATWWIATLAALAWGVTRAEPAIASRHLRLAGAVALPIGGLAPLIVSGGATGVQIAVAAVVLVLGLMIGASTLAHTRKAEPKRTSPTRA